jgi:hypothetical protein
MTTKTAKIQILFYCGTEVDKNVVARFKNFYKKNEERSKALFNTLEAIVNDSQSFEYMLSWIKEVETTSITPLHKWAFPLATNEYSQALKAQLLRHARDHRVSPQRLFSYLLLSVNTTVDQEITNERT